MSNIINEFEQKLESQKVKGISEWIRDKEWEERKLLIDYLEKYDNQELLPDSHKSKSVIRIVQYCLKSVTDVKGIDFDLPNFGEEEIEELLTLYSLKKPNQRYEEIKKDIASPESFLTRIPYVVLQELYKREKVPFDRQIFVACLIRFNVWHWTTFTKELTEEASAKFDSYFPQDEFTLDILMAVFEMELGVNGAFYMQRDFNIGAILIRLVSDGKIERAAIQQKIFEAFSNPTLKQTTHGWAKNVYNGLGFNKEENLKCQSQLIELLHNDRTILVNYGIQQLKKISSDAQFDWEQLIDSLDSIVYRKKLNGGLKTILGFLYKKLKKDSTLLEDVCIKLAPIFLQEEHAVQLEAIKCFTLLEEPNEAVSEALNPFVSTMCSEAKIALNFLFTDEVLDEETTYELYEEKKYRLEPCTESNKIKYIDNEDDFIFLCTKVLKSKDSLDYELFLEGLLRFYKIKETHRKSLQAALKAAKKLADDAYFEPSAKVGFHHLMAAKLICIWLGSEQKTFAKELEYWKGRLINTKKTLDYTTNKWFSCFQAFTRLTHIEKYLRNEKNEEILPLLSTPTHIEGSINPNTFFEKLELYELRNEEINEGDFNLALCRLNRWQSFKNESKHQSEYRAILDYLLDKSAVFDSTKIDKLATTWYTAFTLKNPENRIDNLIAYQKNEDWWNPKPVWDWSVDRRYSESYSWARLNLNIAFDEERVSKFSHSQFAFHLLRNQYGIGDIGHWFYKDIYQVELLSLAFIFKNVYSISYLDAPDVKSITAAVVISATRPVPLNKVGTLFLCVCLFNGETAIRNATLDWLILLIDKGYLRLYLFVEAITKMISNEHHPIPIKRVSEQFEQLLQMGGSHVDVLYKVLESIIASINSENLPKSFKNILHHYHEVLKYVNAPMPENVRTNLEKMKKLNTVKKEVKKLLEL